MRILITGSRGMLGSNIVSQLSNGQLEVIQHSRSICDLSNSLATEKFIADSNPEVILHCAAKVGGINSKNTNNASDYLTNTTIDFNVMNAAWKLQVKNLVYMSSATIYPNLIVEEVPSKSLLRGKLEFSNAFYALAKLTGTNFVTNIALNYGVPWRTLVMPNLYGPYDDFESDSAQVIPSIIRRGVNAKYLKLPNFEVRGALTTKREFVFAPDIADWIVGKIGQLDDLPCVLNLGSGELINMKTCYETILDVLGINPKLTFLEEFPSAQERPIMDSSIARNLGWNPSTKFRQGIERTIEWFSKEYK
jgi:GDP-L-fucose synthase